MVFVGYGSPEQSEYAVTRILHVPMVAACRIDHYLQRRVDNRPGLLRIRSSINSIEPLMLANSIVTVLRSPSRTSLFSAAARSAAEPTAVVEFFAKLPGTRSESDAPQSPQKELSAGFSAPHFRQRPPSRPPHLPQNFLPSGFSVPHFAQRMFPLSLGASCSTRRAAPWRLSGRRCRSPQ